MEEGKADDEMELSRTGEDWDRRDGGRRFSISSASPHDEREGTRYAGSVRLLAHSLSHSGPSPLPPSLQSLPPFFPLVRPFAHCLQKVFRRRRLLFLFLYLCRSALTPPSSMMRSLPSFLSPTHSLLSVGYADISPRKLKLVSGINADSLIVTSHILNMIYIENNLITIFQSVTSCMVA